MNNLDQYYNNLKFQTKDKVGLYLFCCSIGVIWTVYVLFFNSRVVGSIFTFLFNLYVKRYNEKISVRIRSLSISFLSGKIMFRGVHYVTVDYMVFIQDGWINFQYWKPQFVSEKKKSSDKSQNDFKENVTKPKRTARLNIYLCNFQLHYYNSWKSDAANKNSSTQSQDLLNGSKKIRSNSFFRNISSNSLFNYLNRNNSNSNSNTNFANVNVNNSKNNYAKINPNSNTDYDFTEDLMQLFSVVNIRIEKGRVFAGNSTLPSTLSMKWSNAKMELVTEKSQSKIDEYCFILSGDINKLEISFIPNKKFSSDIYNKEKKIENRVVFFRCISCDFKYVQDVPSVLTFDRRILLKTETGELIQNDKEPEWSLLINCNKHTQLNYGPWFDRQREVLWKFFFPATYEKLEPHPEPTLNERRQTSKFDFKIVFKDPNTELNINFLSKTLDESCLGNPHFMNDIQKHVSLTERKITIKTMSESFFNCSIPWLTRQHGYKTQIVGCLNSVQSTTSLSFKELFNSQRVNFNVDINYPLVWNDMQEWNINIELFKSSIYLIFYDKYFFQDLINDWSSQSMADLRHFVPYVYNFDLKANDIELILPCNQYNWIDTVVLENNAFFEVLASKAFLKISIPFLEFLPERTNYLLDIKVYDGCGRFIVPPTNSGLSLLKVLKKKLKFISINDGEQNMFTKNKWSQFNDSNFLNDSTFKQSSKSDSKQSKSKDGTSKQGNNRASRKNQQVPETYSLHLCENWIECWQAQSASVVLSFDYHPCPVIDWENVDLPSVSMLKNLNSPNFDCEIFNPDFMNVEIEIGPSIIMLYGTFLKRLWYIKESYFSWDQIYTEMVNYFSNMSTDKSKNKDSKTLSKHYNDVPISLSLCNQKDPRNFRPFSVKVSLAIHNINGHLVLDTAKGVGNVPFPIGFTKRLVLELDKQYKETKLQLFVEPVNIFLEDNMVRNFDKNLSQGHLCLSNVQVRGHAMFSDEGRTKTDTLEYAWLLEILLGDVTGYLSPIQAEQLVHGLETFLTLLLENEYQLEPVYLDRIDPGLPYKYEIVRFSLDLIDLYVVEAGTALNLNLNPVRLSICNSHTEDYAKGLSALVGQFRLTLFINEASRIEEQENNRNMVNKKVAHDKDASRDDLNDNNSNISKISSSLSVSISSFGSIAESDSDRDTIVNESTNEDQSPNKSNAFSGNNTLKNECFSSKSNEKSEKAVDSDEFNYWFECASLTSGKITFDVALDKGNPKEQIEFLRIHDLKTKRLYFLWDLDNTAHSQSKKLCGCLGGCSYYSVFADRFYFKMKNADDGGFFDTNLSISRANKNFGDSLFYPGQHVLQSQAIMFDKYDIEYYKYKYFSDDVESTSKVYKENFSHSVDELSSEKDERKFGSENLQQLTNKFKSVVKNESKLSLNSLNSNINSNPTLKQSQDVKGGASTRSIRSYSVSSKSLSNGQGEDSYFTADEEDEEKNDQEADEDEDEETFQETQIERAELRKKSSSSSSFDVSEEKTNTLKHNNQTGNQAYFENENKNDELFSYTNEELLQMDLNFDIRRPILESSLPKYCYLKYLSRARVQNWNRQYSYPFYQDFRSKNISFAYRQKGLDFSRIVTFKNNNNSTSNDFKESNSNQDPIVLSWDPNEDKDQIKCRVNLKFSVFECYITPLALTALHRFTDALNSYELNPNSLITELQAESYAYCASNSLIEAISKTQVSLKIPQIRLFSLQCGLAEGDKIFNAFIQTLSKPDEFINLSLFIISIYSIKTQLVDSMSKTAAIFMIDKIDTQFCRLYESDKSNENTHQATSNKQNEKMSSIFQKEIKLSCIPDEYSNTNIRCFETSSTINDVAKAQLGVEMTNYNQLNSFIMYESVFDKISIKAIKKLNDLKGEAEQTPSDDIKLQNKPSLAFNIAPEEDKSAGHKSAHNNRLSILEFDIAKICFSFPEPPTSPKGKRKIPYSRFDWNLLSSVSPAVNSWLCASKLTLKPLKEMVIKRSINKIRILAALISGALKNKEELDKNALAYLKSFERLSDAKSLNEPNLGTRLRNKISAKSNSNTANNQVNMDLALINFQKFMETYLTKSSLIYYEDANCRLVNTLRNYLFYFEDDFNADLQAPNIPDTKYLKNGLNEVLNFWANLISGINEKETNTYKTFTTPKNAKFNETHLNRNAAFVVNEKNRNEPKKTIVNMSHETTAKISVYESKEKLDIDHEKNTRDSKTKCMKYQEIEMENFNVNRSLEKIEEANENNTNTLNAGNQNDEANLSTSFNSLNQSVVVSEENVSDSEKNYQENVENQALDMTTNLGENIESGDQYKSKVNSAKSKIFRPILNFIGIDAPNGTLIDNLFKEFGSLIFGNLNIKSVDINILGKQVLKQFKDNINQPNLSEKLWRTGTEKVVTTILSFDNLEFNINIRQVLSENTSELNSAIEETTRNETTKATQKNNSLSMANPLYTASQTDKKETSNKFSYDYLRHHIKVDSGVKLNNLTQEVNMPLLRLVHQLYSIVADAIEYGKDDKLNKNEKSLGVSEQRLPLFERFDSNQPNKVHFDNSTFSNRYITRSSYCWFFIEELLANDDLKTPRFFENNEIKPKIYETALNQKQFGNYMENFGKEQSSISIFVWLYISKINSKAGLGTLAFNGEMDNFQISLIMNRKLEIMSDRSQIEGSLNICMDSTFGKLTENDSKQNVVQMSVAKSNIFGFVKNLSINNIISAFVNIGQIYIDIPLRPMLVHGVVYRESKVIEQNILPEIKNFVIFENSELASGNETKRAQEKMGGKQPRTNQASDSFSPILDKSHMNNATINKSKLVKVNTPPKSTTKTPKNLFLNKKNHQQHLVNSQNKPGLFSKFSFQLKSKLVGCEIRAKLLENPCLKAAYSINDFECNSLITNEHSKITCVLNSHCLSFQCDDELVSNANVDESTTNQLGINQMMTMKPVEERTYLFLPSISLSGSYTYQQFEFNSTKNVIRGHVASSLDDSLRSKVKDSKVFNISDIKFRIKTSPLNRELNAQVIAQLVFVTKVFIKEMNYILQAVYGLENTNPKKAKRSIAVSKPYEVDESHSDGIHSTNSSETRIFYDLNVEIGKISLTGITPSNTALTIFSGEKSIINLKNKGAAASTATGVEKKYELAFGDYTIKPGIDAKCNLSIELKTLLSNNVNNVNNMSNTTNNGNLFPNKSNQQEKPRNSVDVNEWYQLAYFNTKFDLRNSINNSNAERESIIITVEKPRFYLQPGAVDCAVLFWLNYKNTYEFWLEQRQQFAKFLIDQEYFKSYATPQRPRETQKIRSEPKSDNEKANNFIALKLRVVGLGLALPLSTRKTKDFFSTSTDCLVISLNETVIYACSSGCVVSKGQFNNFCMRFSENFNLSGSEWTPINPQEVNKSQATPGSFMPMPKNIINAWVVPSGNYEVCSSTAEKPIEEKALVLRRSLSAENKENRPVWILSVKWKMEGIEVNLDTAIGKWLSKLADTVTRLADTQNIGENISNLTEQDYEIKKLKDELNYYLVKGDNSKANLIQSRIDVLNFASYPGKAKQIFVKTKNNLRGQLGFITNHQAAGMNNTAKSLQNSPENQKLGDKEQSEKNVFKHNLQRHNLRGDNEFNSQTLVEESESELKNSETSQSDNEPANDTLKNHSFKESTTSTGKQSMQTTGITSAPAIDFKLSVKIDINSGKCILHANKHMSKPSGSKLEMGSPMSNFFNSTGNEYNRTLGMMMSAQSSSAEQDLKNTIFIFPAIGMKSFYESTHKLIDKRLVKKANLYAMIKLESFAMPRAYNNMSMKDLYNTREMCISPALLDFLEQTLEPFDMIKASLESASNTTTPVFNSSIHKSSSKAEDNKPGAYIRSNTESRDEEGENDYNEFKDSSKNDAELEKYQEPSYFPVDVVVFVSMQPSSIRFTCSPHSTMECLLKLPTLETVFSSNRLDREAQEKISKRFNKSEKHKKPQTSTEKNDSSGSNEYLVNTNEGGLSVTCSMTDFSLKFYNRLAIRNHNDARIFYSEHLGYTEEKDSLSVRVAYIKVNISRSKRVSKPIESAIKTKSELFLESVNDVKLSILADIGSTSFVYDMRNIKEVFVFPKIWYRKSLARRVFLGEDSVLFNNEKSTPNPDVHFSDKADAQSPAMQPEGKLKIFQDFRRPKTLDFSLANAQNESLYCMKIDWKTLVLLSVNLVGLEVKMNVGNVMGNVCLITKNARATSKISISRYGPKDILFDFALANCRLIAEGGSNGCLLRIQDVTTSIEVNDLDKSTKHPSHKIEFGIYATECRIDSAYNQASPILAVRFSNLNLKLNDSWLTALSNHSDESKENKITEALIELNIIWDQFHIMITRSTTPDLLILFYKLKDFFEKQFIEGKDYMKEWEFFYELKVKQQTIEKQEKLVKKNFAVNGGNIQLKGNNLTLITFHGSNFKAKKWAVFSLNEPSLDFASQTCYKNGEVNQQNVGFYLGRNQKKRDMASIYMVYRDSTSIFTKFQTINEWFEYAHSSIDAAGLRDFPRFSSDEHPLFLNQTIKKTKVTDQTKWEEIFHLPSLQIFCDTTQENNTVKFEFRTEFHDHILLTFRTELFGFLHELITSYVKEREIIKGKEEYIPVSKTDDRQYDCVKWELEPTLRLISKFGSSVESLGVDALLKSLGFHHARTTIPKWLQRGLLDNLNEVMQNIIKIYVKIQSEHDSKPQQ